MAAPRHGDAACVVERALGGGQAAMRARSGFEPALRVPRRRGFRARRALKLERQLHQQLCCWKQHRVAVRAGGRGRSSISSSGGGGATSNTNGSSSKEERRQRQLTGRRVVVVPRPPLPQAAASQPEEQQRVPSAATGARRQRGCSSSWAVLQYGGASLCHSSYQSLR